MEEANRQGEMQKRLCGLRYRLRRIRPLKQEHFLQSKNWSGITFRER